MISFHGLLISSLFLISINAFNYEMDFTEKKLFVPCEDKPGLPLNKVLDMSNFDIEVLDDGSVHANGSTKIVYNLKPDTKVQMVLQIYKKDRDNWVSTIYNIKRSDACLAIFDPMEVWHRYVENIPTEERICPYYTGQKFNVNASSKFNIHLVDPRLDGDYKLTANFFILDGDPSAFVCMNIFYTIYRVREIDMQ